MNAKQLVIGLVKLIICGLAYFVGLMVGGRLAVALQLPQPPMPSGVSQATAALSLLFASPALALGLALVGRDIAGSWPARALMLASLVYVAYSLNTVLDASLYVTGVATTLGFQTISPIVPSLLCGGAVAWLFPPAAPGKSFIAAWQEFFRKRTPGEWLWRLVLAGLAFAPVYVFFGLLVNPFTGAYYTQNMYGLKAATWEQIIPVQLARSLLFLLACLPIIVAWQKSSRSLFLSLAAAQFVLVGLTMVLIGSWLPWTVRLPHAVEILCDSFVYAGILTWLLAWRSHSPRASVLRPPSFVAH